MWHINTGIDGGLELMRLGFAVNDIRRELADYTTTHLAMAATDMAHEVWYINIGDFSLHPDDSVFAWAYTVPKKVYRSAEVYLRALQEKQAHRERIRLGELDVLMLRNDPHEDTLYRPWARMAGINFGRLAIRCGVIVLNDPNTLALSLTKLYMMNFPETVRPRTLITRDRLEAREFIDELGGYAIFKPLFGSGGRNVFLVQPEDISNVNQMFETVCRDGYVIAQEYLPDAVNGDTRLFVMNGKAFSYKGKYAIVNRVHSASERDLRSNLSAGGISRAAKINDGILQLVETVGPILSRDGIFLAGLDIVGDKIMEINVLSPGALVGTERLQEAPFCRMIIQALEKKVEYKKKSGRQLDNIELATL